ncbi:Olfactory receptor 9A4 [Pteropus alecto]|uniref:Olfactory receptor 9A4 n=1 Tax=Pteropus alecto TaxID=9402 RepID=L5KSJ6_PTEAL|nr:Olfactory receptor 9A4 [Pteropus alecto]
MLGNHASTTEFYLLGFPGSEELRHILFATFFFFYSVTLMGTTVIIVVVCVDKRLQSPRYFFLGHLSTLEILTTSIIAPVMLWGLLLPGMQSISLAACVTQLFLYLAVGTTEFALLGAMAVDRYVAVCNPLRYNVIMNSHTCIWVFILFLMAVFVLFDSLIPTIVSYTYIISTILKIPSTSGRRKAFSACASHFTCVVIGYSTCLFLYVKPKQTQAAEYNRVASLMVSVVIPLLNPFIFTLCKVTEALRDAVKRCCQLFRSEPRPSHFTWENSYHGF